MCKGNISCSEGFHPGVQLYPKVSSPKVPTSHRVLITLPGPIERRQLRLRVNLRCAKKA